MKSIGAVFILLFIITGCQKGIHWDLLSEGALTKDVNGNCLPVTTAGNFIIHKPTGDSNFLTVNVDVTAEGTYTITSDSINGYSFKASGVFNNTGNIAVKLTCSGTPLVEGTDHFTIYYNNSLCEASILVQPDTIPIPVSNYMLAGSPGNCMNDTVKGSYIQAITLDTLDKVIISVDVITPGSYSIFTNTVNGYNFSASGIFTNAGIQTVTLSGSGTPANAGNNIFTLTASANTCNFSIAVVSAVTVTNNDYFPLSNGSYWNYDDLVNTGDTIKRSIEGDTLIDNLSYAIINESKRYNSSRYYFSKNLSDYTEYGKADKYTASFQYGSAVYGLLPFLKENLAAGQSWLSEEFKGTASFGQVLYIKYAYTCLNNNTAITINGLGFKNVYVIAVYPYLRSEGNPYGSTNEAYFYYYAKGVGLIYLEAEVGVYKHPAMQIRNWYIN